MSLDETMSAGDLRVVVAALVGHDVQDRVDSIGNSRAAVMYRKDVLVSIAHRVPNRTGDARPISRMTCDQLREFIARNVDCEPPPPGQHFTWVHLKALYQELGGPMRSSDTGPGNDI